MYRGPPNPDYHRAPVPASGFGHPAASFGPPPFCSPFGVPLGPQYCAPQPGPPPGLPYGTGNENYNRESFYENRPFTSRTADQSESTIISSQLTPSNQLPLGQSSSWSNQSLDDQNQEVRKKAEEFLRILQASDRIELAVDKSDISDRTTDKHPSRARSRSRGRSRPRSRSRSRGRSQGRCRARSRGKSRARSRTRSRSRAKSRTRAKSRARSRSRSRGKSVTSRKSQSRLSPSQTKQSYRGTAEGHSSSSTSSGASFGANAVPDLFHGLRQILQNKDLEKHLPMVKNALRDQRADDTRCMFLGKQSAVGGFQSPEPETSVELCCGSLLPHERTGGDSGSASNILSWNTPNQLSESKPAFQSVEDEEKFLYGEQEERSKPQAVTVPLAQTRSTRSPVHHLLKEQQNRFLKEPKTHGIPANVQPAGLGTMKVTPEECEKVRNLLRTIGMNPGMTEICKMAARLKEKKEEQGVAASFPLLKPALEALQALSRASKTDDSRSNRSGSSHSTQESKREEKNMGEKERERREKQIQKKRKEYLVKELEGLMKQEGSGDLIPVMGFFCQRCEEFFGDLNRAERHVASHSRIDKKKTIGSQEHRDAKRYGDQHHTPSHRQESPSSGATSSRVHHEHGEHSPDRKRTRDESPQPTDIIVKNVPEGKGSKVESKDKSKEKTEKPYKDNDDTASTKSEKKRKKKEKKLKKKEKKKKKDKKKANADKDSS